MKTIILKRISHTEKATFGVLIYKSIPFCVSLELPWKDNLKNISCIPEGEYTLFVRKDRKAYRIKCVQERFGIEIHVGNTAKETKGCILLGEMFEPLANECAVRKSAIAFSQLEHILNGDDYFKLKIIPPHRNEYLEGV